MSTSDRILLCPGQGAQKIGMGREWVESHPASAQTFAAADEALDLSIGGSEAKLTDLCFNGPAESLNRTDISQPALYTCSVASFQGLLEIEGSPKIRACAGLSLGEWTALHLAGVIGFIDGLRLVALRGRLMQEAAEASQGSMVALIGADEAQADEVCSTAADGDVLVPANYNATGQIVISGSKNACTRSLEVAGAMGLKATELAVAGAFHSPLMEPAAEGLAKALEEIHFSPPQVPVWSNVTGEPHDGENLDSIKKRLVEQLTSPVRWHQCCTSMVETIEPSDEQPLEWHEMAPGTVLRGLFRRIDRKVKVQTHDEPEPSATTDAAS
ncbi:MAG: ACP S-malonyltransferase [Planctomycetota bacterium]|nr:ACP S-malonyltransferase [Planctomycetota bacterium]